jgi:hypothetical protein
LDVLSEIKKQLTEIKEQINTLKDKGKQADETT